MQDKRHFKQYGIFFLVLCLLAVLVFGYVVLRPFLYIFLLALVLATISYPAYRRLRAAFKGRESLAALTATLLVVMLMIVPCLALLGLMAAESVQMVRWVSQKVDTGVLDQSLLQPAVDLQQRFLPRLDLRSPDVGKALTDVAARFSQMLMSWSTSAVVSITSAVWQFLLMLFALYYFYKDGSTFLSWVLHLLPLPASLEKEIVQKFGEVSRSAFFGTFLTALAQGFLGGIAFLIVGLPPLVWGVAMAFFSLIPVVGTFAVWGPAALILMLTERVGSGIFLAGWGIVVVGASDNLLRPLLMQGRSRLHPLLMFFSLLGGIMAFGPLGILLGPLAIVLVISMLRAYEEAARPFLSEMDQR